ncbi:MAG: hypothetical protein MHMPM18_002854, partial [Marteilia pararefringens]
KFFLKQRIDDDDDFVAQTLTINIIRAVVLAIKKGGGVSNKLRVVRICVYCKFVMVVSESQRQRKDEDNDDNHSIHSTIGDTLSFQQLERLHDKQIATILRYYQLFEASNSIPIMSNLIIRLNLWCILCSAILIQDLIGICRLVELI